MNLTVLPSTIHILLAIQFCKIFTAYFDHSSTYVWFTTNLTIFGVEVSTAQGCTSTVGLGSSHPVGLELDAYLLRHGFAIFCDFEGSIIGMYLNIEKARIIRIITREYEMVIRKQKMKYFTSNQRTLHVISIPLHSECIFSFLFWWRDQTIIKEDVVYRIQMVHVEYVCSESLYLSSLLNEKILLSHRHVN